MPSTIKSVCFLAGLATLLFQVNSVRAAPPANQVLIDFAASIDLTKFQNDAQNLAVNVRQVKAMNLLALTVFLEPNATTSDGIPVRSHLLQHIRSLITGGQEPNAAGSLAGWTHNGVAQTLLLAKNTPVVWDKLTADERSRIDWLMRAMAVAGHFCFDDDNNFKTDLRDQGNFDKGWGANYREGYVGVVIAASLYFGATELNNIYTSFNFDEYIGKFNQYGFTNIRSTWTSHSRWKGILENGTTFIGSIPIGNDGHGGNGRGVRNTFTYQGVGLSNPFGIYKKLADFMYSETVIDGLTKNGQAYSWTLNGMSSPYLGQQGMCSEFNTIDASGPRTSAHYVGIGWTNSIYTAATLKALGAWTGPQADIAAVESKMRVGSEDYIFKATSGFQNYASGAYETAPDESAFDWTGFPYCKAVWLNYLSPDSAGVVTVSLAAPTPIAQELGPTPGVVSLTRTGSTVNPLPVRMTFGGTAAPGTDYQAITPVALIPAGQASVNILVTPIPNNTPQQDRTVSFGLFGSTFVGNSGRIALITLKDKPFDAWRYSRFNSTQLANESISGPLADPDKDGLNNIFEYAFDTNPLTYNSPVAVQPTVAIIDETLTLTYKKLRSDLIYTPQWSNNLTDWFSGPGYLTEQSSGNFITAIASPSLSEEPRQFLRLTISTP